MNLFDSDNAYFDTEEECMQSDTKHFCAVCEREIYDGEACYCFEGEAVCENCCSAYIIDNYWYASPSDI